MASDELRTRRSRDRAAEAYALLLDAAGERWRDMVLVGGLVPETLVDSDEPHQGTLDVDVLLPLALQYDRDADSFGWLESALGRAAFVPVHENTGWRWFVSIDGAPVVVEFLAAVREYVGPDSAGAVTYATEAITAGSEETRFDLAADAVAAVAAFAVAFRTAAHRAHRDG
ncbi:hypothetical protein [Curtobacterium sp. VKM Ac-1393]|uniref:hypothetical protein n=1 Tax=Curtobacterium sp. VKM Ac-1393 TaxID=2783814 RepID=UPI00188C2EC7|nr:hypothetical protein [Curtobacterium sp. VKM Ac-1393]MBF4606381.1 hypothetical protein [Curtobacterium sp. VKM Ac-1393]